MSYLSIRRRLCNNDDEFIERLEKEHEEEIKVVKQRQIDLEAETRLLEKALNEAAQKIETKTFKIIQLEATIEAIIMIALVLLAIVVAMLC